MKRNNEMIFGTAVLATGAAVLIYKLASRRRNKNKVGYVVGGVLAAGGTGVLVHGLVRKDQPLLLSDDQMPLKLLADKNGKRLQGKPSEMKKPEKVPKNNRGIKIALKLLRENPNVPDVVKNAMNENIVKGIYAAEKKRMMLMEKIGTFTRIRWLDGNTVGYGQISNLAFKEVMDYYSEDFCEYCAKVGLPNDIALEKGFGNYLFEDFVVTYYLVHCIKNANKGGRSVEDMVKVGILIYHSGTKFLREIQNDILEPNEKDVFLFSNIKEALVQLGGQDIVDYIEEVYGFSDMKD